MKYHIAMCPVLLKQVETWSSRRTVSLALALVLRMCLIKQTGAEMV